MYSKEPVLEGHKHSFVQLPNLREWETVLNYDVFKAHKVARISISEGTTLVALEDARVDVTDLEEDMMDLFGADDFTYVSKHELSGVS